MHNSSLVTRTFIVRPLSFSVDQTKKTPAWAARATCSQNSGTWHLCHPAQP
jgi:hypothetical protein